MRLFGELFELVFYVGCSIIYAVAVVVGMAWDCLQQESYLHGAVVGVITNAMVPGFRELGFRSNRFRKCHPSCPE